MASIKVQDRRYELVQVDSLTFSQQRNLKRLTSGMTLPEIELGFKALDVDAWFGVVFMTVQKVNPAFTEDELEDLNFVEIMGSIEGDADDEADAVPPPSESSEAASAPASSGEASPEAPGTPSSQGGSE